MSAAQCGKGYKHDMGRTELFYHMQTNNTLMWHAKM